MAKSVKNVRAYRIYGPYISSRGYKSFVVHYLDHRDKEIIITFTSALKMCMWFDRRNTK